jgi:hypothetical protein
MEVRITLGFDPRGRQLRKKFVGATRGEVTAKVKAALEAQDQGLALPDPKQTVGARAAHWASPWRREQRARGPCGQHFLLPRYRRRQGSHGVHQHLARVVAPGVDGGLCGLGQGSFRCLYLRPRSVLDGVANDVSRLATMIIPLGERAFDRRRFRNLPAGRDSRTHRRVALGSGAIDAAPAKPPWLARRRSPGKYPDPPKRREAPRRVPLTGSNTVGLTGFEPATP